MHILVSEPQLQHYCDPRAIQEDSTSIIQVFNQDVAMSESLIPGLVERMRQVERLIRVNFHVGISVCVCVRVC
jgi:hypothetical protein